MAVPHRITPLPHKGGGSTPCFGEGVHSSSGEETRSRRAVRGRRYSFWPRCIMQERCLWSCWTPQVDSLIFPASPLHSRIAFSRALLIPASPRSLRCAKLGVASADTASAMASAVRSLLILIMVGLLYLSCANHLERGLRET